MDSQHLEKQECPEQTDAEHLFSEADPLFGTVNEVLPQVVEILPAQYENDLELYIYTHAWVQDSAEAALEYTYLVPVEAQYQCSNATSASLETGARTGLSPDYSQQFPINLLDRYNNSESATLESPEYSQQFPINLLDSFNNWESATLESPEYSQQCPINLLDRFNNSESATLESPEYSQQFPINLLDPFNNSESATLENPEYSQQFPINLLDRFNNSEPATLESPEYSQQVPDDVQDRFNNPVASTKYLKFREKNTANTRKSRERKRLADEKMKQHLMDLEVEHAQLMEELEEAKKEREDLKAQLARKGAS